MDKITYLALRKNFDFKLEKKRTAIFYAQDFTLLSTILYVCYFYKTSPLRLVAIPLIAILMFRNFSMMHDAVHSCVSKNKSLNTFSGMFAGAFSLLPYESWREIHLEHHFWSGNIEKDPVMALVRTFPKWTVPTKSSITWAWKLWFPILACLQYGVFWYHCSLKLKSHSRSPKHLLSYFLPLLLWSMILAISPASLVFSVLLPAVFLYLLAVEVVNFPHHLGLPQHEGEKKIAVWNQHQTARSCIYPKWFAELVVLNFNYHIEHHMFPDAPWYKLPSLHLMIKDQLAEDYNSDPQFEWILRNRKKDMRSVLITEPEQTSETQAA